MRSQLCLKEEQKIKLEKHILISASASLIFYLYCRSIAGTVACFLTGFLIDLDHVPDYLISTRFRSYSLREFFSACHEMRLSRFYLVLHSYELIPVIIFAGQHFHWNYISVGISIGFILHLLIDEISNRKKYGCKYLFYFFTYRLLKGFRKEQIFDPLPTQEAAN